jgi:DNA-binding FadR family transcriptional regulator
MNDTHPLPARKKARTLAHSVVAHISDMIRDGRIAPGEKIPSEAEVIATLGVSRSVVREAVSQMQAAGLGETFQGIGTFAVAGAPQPMGMATEGVVTMKDVLALLELRISLETEAAGLAASRRTDSDLARIHAALAHFLALCRSGAETAQADTAFHLSIAHAADNRFLYDTLNHLGTRLLPEARKNTVQFTRDAPSVYIERVTREHDDIVTAIVRRDPESARAAMRTHLSNSRERLRRAYEAHEAKSG